MQCIDWEVKKTSASSPWGAEEAESIACDRTEGTDRAGMVSTWFQSHGSLSPRTASESRGPSRTLRSTRESLPFPSPIAAFTRPFPLLSSSEPQRERRNLERSGGYRSGLTKRPTVRPPSSSEFGVPQSPAGQSRSKEPSEIYKAAPLISVQWKLKEKLAAGPPWAVTERD